MPQELQGKRIAVLVEDDFEDRELLEPLEALKNEGAQTTIVGSGSKEVYTGKRGAPVRADKTAREVTAADFDAVIIPGGYAPDKMRLYPAMVNLVKEAYQQGKIVAAICHGPQLLISADVVRGRTATCWPSIAVDLQNAGAIFVDQPVVRDGNLITSRKPDDVPAFNRAIIEALSGRAQAAA